MREYELTALIHPDLEDDIDAAISKLRDIVVGAGGKIIRENVWGKKKLAYQIKKLDFAIYVYFEVSLPADAPVKISNTLNITDEVIRYLLVAVDEKARKALAEAKSKKSSEDDDVKEEE